MMTLISRFRVLLGAAALLVGSGLLGAETIPLSAFLTPAAYSSPQLSPDGTKLAMLVRMDRREQIIVLDLKSMQPRQAASAAGDDHGVRFSWKGNGMLILISDGLFRRLNLETSELKPFSRLSEMGGQIVNILPEDPEHVLVSVYGHGVIGAELRRLEINSGKMTVVEPGPDYVRRWVTDGQGRAVAALGLRDDKWFMLTRQKPDAPWHRIEMGNSYQPGFSPIAVHPDGGRLYGFDYAGERVRSGVFDPVTGSREHLVPVEEESGCTFEFWDLNRRHPRSIYYGDDRPQRFCLDQEAAGIYAALDAALPPGRFNEVVDRSSNGTVLLIWSRSDRTMGEYYLLDRATKRITSLGPCQADLPEQAMRPGRTFHFAARDGLPLSGRIVLPVASEQKPPLILLIGPYLNGPAPEWAFDRQEQLFASRGYAVARLNYRGAAGLGGRVFAAGEKQVLGGMPDDLEDGVRWLVQQGWVAPRVGIFGDRAGALLAVQLAARAEPFAVWINYLGQDAGWMGGPVWKTGLEIDPDRLYGKEREARSYFDSLEGALKKMTIRVPALHLYQPNSYDDVVRGRMEAFSKRAGQPYVTHLAYDEAYREKHFKGDAYSANIAADVDVYTQVLDFLNRYLPVAAPAAK